MKFEAKHNGNLQLQREYRAYRILSGSEGIPYAYSFEQDELYSMLVIELLGPTLEQLFNACGRRFQTKTVCLVAKQMVGFTVKKRRQ